MPGRDGEGSLAPRDAAELAEIVRTHAGPLEPRGGGSKRSIGRPVDAEPLELSALAGVLDYAPDELVLTARAATPLGQIEQTLAEHGQRLAFEPPDLGPLLGSSSAPTLGGVLVSNLSGSRRLTAGAARDHFLGFHAVSGRGERFKAGGQVVKNVTGYDLPKVLAGSWGTLAVLTRVTVRVAPAPESERTLVVPADAPERAVELARAAFATRADVSAAAFDPEHGCALWLEGLRASVEARATMLLERLGVGDAERIDDQASRALWESVGGAQPLAEWPVVWRISVPPTDAPRVVAALEPERYLLDWAGGLIWAAFHEADAVRVRGALREGHATLVKAPIEARAAIAVFQPQPAAIAAAAARLKAAFDPDGKLSPGRIG